MRQGGSPRDPMLRFAGHNACGLIGGQEDQVESAKVWAKALGYFAAFWQETWFSGDKHGLETQMCQEDQWTFLWNGLSNKVCRRGSQGVGIFISPEARVGWERAGKLEIRDFGERIIATKVHVHDERGRQQYLYLASAYAPQSGDVVGRAQFLQQLQRLFDSVKKNELLVLSMDANAAMGIRRPTAAGVPKGNVLGPNGVSHVNNAGRDLYQLLDANEMCSAATFFKPKVDHATWTHPGNGHGYQNDHFILRQRDLKRVRACQPTTVAGVVSDHLPLTIRLRVTTNMEQHMKKPEPRPYIDRKRLCNENVADEFLALLEADLDASEEIEDRPDSLTRLIKAMQGASKNSLAVMRKRVPSWFEEYAHVLVPAIQARNARLREHLKRKTIGSAKALKKARRTLKTSMKGAINAWHSKVLDGVNQLGEVKTGSNAG